MVSPVAGAGALRDPWVVTYCIFLGLLTARATACHTMLLLNLKNNANFTSALAVGGGAETICHILWCSHKCLSSPSCYALFVGDSRGKQSARHTVA